MIEIKNKVWLACVFTLIFFSCALTETVQGQSDIPKKAIDLFNKGLAQQSYGEYEEAISLFNQALKKAPHYIDALDALANTYQREKDFTSAISNYKKILMLKSDHVFALYELGEIYFGLDNLDSADFFYKSFLKINSTDDKYANIAREALENIDFAKYAKAHPVNITPVNLGPSINTIEQEYSPAFAIDEQTLYITRRVGDLKDSRPNEDIYYATRSGDTWNPIRNLGPPINTIENEGAFSVSADGHYIFFTSCSRSGGVGQCDIWITIDKNGAWSEPLNLQKPVNSKYWESQPSISSNGKMLYFTSDRPGGFGGTDIWMSRFGDKGWEEPINLGKEINTSKDEQFPFIHPDNTTLYFSSMGHLGMGKSDIFVTHLRPDSTFDTPKNLGYPINTTGYDWNMVVARDGKTAYYSSDNKPDGKGGLDIYSFELPKELQAQRVSYVRGTVIDAKTKRPLSASISLTPLDGSASTSSYTDAIKGQFMVPLKADIQYSLTIDKKEYLFHSEYFDMPNVPTHQPFDLKIELQKLEVGKTVVLNNIFFDTDKFALKNQSKSELEKLKEFMTLNTDISIEIGGHTDNAGSSSHNQILSENRAKSVYQYLTANGVAGTRLSYKGYGDTAPIASNASETGRARNRRTEFKVVK
jgi:outer membrane protein OmpA-like peptidoglycan-associated protein